MYVQCAGFKLQKCEGHLDRMRDRMLGPDSFRLGSFIILSVSILLLIVTKIVCRVVGPFGSNDIDETRKRGERIDIGTMQTWCS